MPAPEYTKDSIIEFGQYKGTKISDIPSSWIKWINYQKWFRKSREHKHLSLKRYIENNIELIK